MKNFERSVEELDARAEDTGAGRACCGTCVVTCNVCSKEPEELDARAETGAGRICGGCFMPMCTGSKEPEELDAEPELRASRGCYCFFCAGLCTPSKEPEELDASGETEGGRACGVCGGHHCLWCGSSCNQEPEDLNRH